MKEELKLAILVISIVLALANGLAATIAFWMWILK